MKLEPIVTHLTDTDFYKFTMGQVYLHKMSDLCGTYIFKCRNLDVEFTKDMYVEICEQVNHLCTLKFTDQEIQYLHTIPFLSYDYVEFLRLWRPLRDYVTIKFENGKLDIKVTGPLYSAMQFEIYLLEIVNEVYFAFKYDYFELLSQAREKLHENIEAFKSGKYNFKFAEFGCRRRLSRAWEEEVVRTFAREVPNMVGTSNVYLAMKYHLKPIGTYAHEYVEAFQGIKKIPLAYTNYYALKTWYAEYGPSLGTALTDTLGTDIFLADFGRDWAQLYQGVRHDSGDPIEWGNKILKHYRKFGVDTKTKTLLFSDSLDFDKAQLLYDIFKDDAKVSFGIGTYVSNNTNVPALNIVIKLQEVNGRPVAKLSDAPGKTMCQNEQYAKYLREAVNYRLENE